MIKVFMVAFMTRDHRSHLETVIAQSTTEAESDILDNWDVEYLYGTVAYDPTIEPDRGWEA